VSTSASNSERLRRKSKLPPVPPSPSTRGFAQALSVEKDGQAEANLAPTIRQHKFVSAPATLPSLDDGEDGEDGDDDADARSTVALPVGRSRRPVQREVLRAALRKRAFASGQLDEPPFEVCEVAPPTQTEVFAPPRRDLSARKAFYRSAHIQFRTMTELRLKATDAIPLDGEH
jgi:hypothetical protein